MVAPAGLILFYGDDVNRSPGVSHQIQHGRSPAGFVVQDALRTRFGEYCCKVVRTGEHTKHLFRAHF